MTESVSGSAATNSTTSTGFLFFFKQKTAYELPKDWSSDVCSSDLFDLVDRVADLLKRRKRVSYRSLKREFDLDDAGLEDLKYELVEMQELAADESGMMLVWRSEERRVGKECRSTGRPGLRSRETAR